MGDWEIKKNGDLEIFVNKVLGKKFLIGMVKKPRTRLVFSCPVFSDWFCRFSNSKIWY
jgi:hypothetical protein